MKLRYVVLSLFAACGSAPSPDAGVDAGTTMTVSDAGTDAGTDPLAGRWKLTGTVNFGGSNTYMFETPITLTRASDGNYRADSAGCTIPFVTVNATTLSSVDTTCTFSESELTETKLNGNTPAFGSDISMHFLVNGEIRLVAGVLSVSGPIVNLQFPMVTGTYSFSGAR